MNLSDKIFDIGSLAGTLIPTKDVKEFIKEIMEEMLYPNKQCEIFNKNLIKEKAGDDLI